MITLYDKRRPHSAAVDAPDPGDARGARDAQRAERDVRRGDGLLARHQARRDPPGAAHLRLHLLPGAGPHERVRRAPVQGASSTTATTPHAVGSDGGSRRAPRRAPAGASCVLAGPGDRRDEDLVAIAAAVAGRSTTTSAAATTICAAAARTKCRASRRRRCVSAAFRGVASRHPRRAGGDRRGAANGQARRPVVDLRRCAGALLEADHKFRPHGAPPAVEEPVEPALQARARTRSATGNGAARAAAPAAGTPTVPAPHRGTASSHGNLQLEGLIRDERGIRLAPEAED